MTERAVSEREGSDVAALVLAVLSFVLCPIVLAIIALALAHGSTSGTAHAARILARVHLALWFLGGLLILALVLVANVGRAV